MLKTLIRNIRSPIIIRKAKHQALDRILILIVGCERRVHWRRILTL
jgi:hypothetical protein